MHTESRDLISDHPCGYLYLLIYLDESRDIVSENHWQFHIVQPNKESRLTAGMA